MASPDDVLLEHYRLMFGGASLVYAPVGGRAHEMPPSFFVAEFAPRGSRSTWIYATLGLSPPEGDGLELFMETRAASPRHSELLTVVGHYHLTGAKLGLHHTVNFGEPWVRGSLCTRAYLSLPYQFGPSLEWLRTTARATRCLWLLPIAEAERSLILEHGADALERQFERVQPDLGDPRRPSVC